MAHKAKSPLAATSGTPNALLSWRAESGSECKSAQSNFQSIGVAADGVVADLATRRAAWLARRHQLASTMARAVEALAFAEARP